MRCYLALFITSSLSLSVGVALADSAGSRPISDFSNQLACHEGLLKTTKSPSAKYFEDQADQVGNEKIAVVPTNWIKYNTTITSSRFRMGEERSLSDMKASTQVNADEEYKSRVRRANTEIGKSTRALEKLDHRDREFNTPENQSRPSKPVGGFFVYVADKSYYVPFDSDPPASGAAETREYVVKAKDKNGQEINYAIHIRREPKAKWLLSKQDSERVTPNIINSTPLDESVTVEVQKIPDGRGAMGTLLTNKEEVKKDSAAAQVAQAAFNDYLNKRIHGSKLAPSDLPSLMADRPDANRKGFIVELERYHEEKVKPFCSKPNQSLADARACFEAKDQMVKLFQPALAACSEVPDAFPDSDGLSGSNILGVRSSVKELCPRRNSLMLNQMDESTSNSERKYLLQSVCPSPFSRGIASNVEIVSPLGENKKENAPSANVGGTKRKK